MKIVIAGGSGQIGTVLAREFTSRGDQVTVLSRSKSVQPWRVVPWDAQTLGKWKEELESTDVVINLTGRSVNCRYTNENKRLIKETRVKSTGVLGRAIAQCQNPPKLWLQMSTATIYSHRYDNNNDEYTGIIGGNEDSAPSRWRFSIDVATSWEQAVDEAVTPHTRKIKLRSSMVMSPDSGGIFATLLRLVRLGLGGASGDGKQFVSWITDTDFIRAIDFLIENKQIDGVVNIAAPYPVTNAMFMKELRQAWGMPIGLPATDWMLEIGAVFLQTETELILKSRRVVPGKLLSEGFEFQFPTWDVAAKELCSRWREPIQVI